LHCNSTCSRKLIYFNDRLDGKNCGKSMKVENRTTDMEDFIQYSKKMLKLGEPAIFYDMFCKYLRIKTRRIPFELKHFVYNATPVPLPRPGTCSQLLKKVIPFE